MIFLLLILYMSPEGELDVKHIGTLGSQESCMEEKRKIEALNPPAGTRVHCMPTAQTKGMII
jgi:hypothetical protein